VPEQGFAVRWRITLSDSLIRNRRKHPPFGAVAASMPRSAPAAQICALCGDHCW
jgi:hypothetical protein